MREVPLLLTLAGEGEVARYMRRSTPSSPFPLLPLTLLRRPRGRVGGGVLGGEAWKVAGREGVDESDDGPKVGESGIAEACETNEMLGPSVVRKSRGKRPCSGDDCDNWC